MTDPPPISDRALNRALLARQGLLKPMTGSLCDTLAAVGAVQTQYWPSLGPALWSRVASCSLPEVYQALAAREIVAGTLLRGTIHTVTWAQYPAYAQVTAASRVARWWHGKEQPGAAVADLAHELRRHAASPRDADQLREHAESWAARNPGVFSDTELAMQRALKWRPLTTGVGLLRTPADGRWGPKTPKAFQAADVPDPADLTALAAPTGAGARAGSVESALDTVIRAHLRGFGPAAADDVAQWIGWNISPVRAALRHMTDLVRFADKAGRELWDLPEAPRPHSDTEAPVRMLPWFDSVLLAYAPKHRTRVLPEPFRDAVFFTINGQIKATFLVDGSVAGTWSVKTARGVATVTLTPLRRLTAHTRRELEAVATRLLEFSQPAAKAHRVEHAR